MRVKRKEESMTDREKLISASLPFLTEIQDMTTGTEVERWLNAK